MEMQYNLETITPIKAQIMLKSNPKNRNINEAHVDFLASQMKSGKWAANGQTVVFDEHDILMDGQHRLNAIVSSGVPVEFLVVRGADPKTMNTIDTGKSRSAGDVFTLNNVMNANCVSSTAKFLMIFENKTLHVSGSSKKCPNDYIYDYYMKRAESIQWALSVGKKMNLSNSKLSQTACAITLLTKKYGQQPVLEFALKIKDGGDYAKSPTHLYPNWVNMRKFGDIKTHRYEQVFCLIWCFEKWMAGAELKQLNVGTLIKKSEYFYAKYEA
jgi:hypothetical protein